MYFTEEEMEMIRESVRRDYNNACEYTNPGSPIVKKMWDLLYKVEKWADTITEVEP